MNQYSPSETSLIWKEINRAMVAFSIQCVLWGSVMVLFHYNLFDKMINGCIKSKKIFNFLFLIYLEISTDISDEERAKNEYTIAEKNKVLNDEDGR